MPRLLEKTIHTGLLAGIILLAFSWSLKANTGEDGLVEVTASAPLYIGRGEVDVSNMSHEEENTIPGEWEFSLEVGDDGHAEWSLTVTDPWPPDMMGDLVYTLVIAAFDETLEAALALQEFSVAPYTPFVARGECEQDPQTSSWQFFLLMEAAIDVTLELLADRPPTYGVSRSHISQWTNEAFVTNKMIEPLDGGWYRLSAEFVYPEDSYCGERPEQIWVKLALFDTDGWRVMQAEILSDPAAVLGEESFSTDVYCEQEIGGFQLLTIFNSAGG